MVRTWGPLKVWHPFKYAVMVKNLSENEQPSLRSYYYGHCRNICTFTSNNIWCTTS